MTLALTRQHFVEISGRYDLVVDSISWADNGANLYIQAGQRWLDRYMTINKTPTKYYKTLAEGAWYDLIADCRNIKEVWISNADGNKWKLVKRNLGDLLYYSTDADWITRSPNIPRDIRGTNILKDPALLDKGAPINYSPIILRSMPATPGVVTIDMFGAVTYSDTTRSYYNLDGVMFLPPAKPGHVLEVTGQFYQPKLVNDTDQNFWTEQEEFSLILAACRAIEVTMRNQQGVADWESAIHSELQGMEFDLIEEESAESPEMGG